MNASEPEADQGVVRLIDVDEDVRRNLVRSTALRIIATTSAVIGAYYLLPDSIDARTGVLTRIVVGLAVLAVVVAFQIRALGRARYPQLKAAEGFAFALTALVATFSFSYLSMSVNDPAAFDEPLGHTDALYFTLTTVTTVGFGDVAPKTEAARGLVIGQMVIDFVLIGVGVRLLSLETKRRLGATRPSS